MSNPMLIFPKFDALEYLNDKPQDLGALGGLGAVILLFEKMLGADDQERFDERAAILEFDGGMSRAEAEIQAANECAKK